MSLKIKKTTGETFDLPTDYVIEGEKTNPLFTNKGSKTVPIHFPNTDNNRKLLLNAERLDKLERPDGTFPVVVETGAIQQSGLMAINSAFNAGIGFDESEMYNKMSQTYLKDLSNLPSLSKGGDTLDERLDNLLSHLTAVMKEEEEADYFVFPVILNREVTDDKTYFIILNEVDVIYGGDIPEPYGIAELKGITNRMIDRYIDGEEVTLDAPKGYGVSPFIKTYKVLEFIFDHFGYTIEENPFKEHRQLKKLVVLNNVMDAVVTGSLYYKDMMPDITIQSFLDGLYNKFGMQYFLNSNTKTVKIKFLKDTLIPFASGSIDLSNYKTEEPQISYASSKQLKLVANREIEEAKTAFDTYEEFLETYNNQFTDSNKPHSGRVTSFFYVADNIYQILDAADYDPIVTSSDFFDWDKKDNLAYEEIKMDDLCVPLLRYDESLILLFYSVNYKHLYTNMSISGSAVDSEESPAKLAFAFGWGITTETRPWLYNFFFASQFNRDVEGEFMYDPDGERYDISLTCNREDGLYNRFWKWYDAFLRHSNFEIKCKLKLLEIDIFGLDMFKTVLLNNQPLLPKQIKYKLNQKDSISECYFKTLRLYEPYDLEKEQKIPTYENQKYYWDLEVVNVPDPNQYPLESWRMYEGQTIDGIWIDEVPYPTSKIVMMPPTEEQFQNQEKREFIYNYKILVLDIPGYPKGEKIPIKQTATYTPKKIEY